MSKDYSLSDKRIWMTDFDNAMYDEYEIKIFVRKLKEEFIKTCFRDVKLTGHGELDGLYEGVPYHYTSYDFLKVIDKFAGEYLVENSKGTGGKDE